MQQGPRTNRTLAVVGIVALIILGAFFYMQWQNSMEQRADDQLRNNPVIQTANAIQTRAANP